jgi:hypothetical protein
MAMHYMAGRLLDDSITVCYMGILQNFKIYVQLDIQIPKDPQSFLSANLRPIHLSLFCYLVSSSTLNISFSVSLSAGLSSNACKYP